MQDAPMTIEARFDARLLDELKRENEALRTALKRFLLWQKGPLNGDPFVEARDLLAKLKKGES